MKLIVGLGNPGEKYEKTRHNLGFLVVEKFLKDFETVKDTVWEDSKKFKSDIAQIEWQPKRGTLEKAILVKPRTYMNNSGLAVSLICSFYKIVPEDVWAIHDDIDLPLGALKIRLGGASAGHHGVESIMEYLSSDKFWRLRMGIGIRNARFAESRREKLKMKNEKLRAVDNYVLGEFRGNEKGKVKELVKRTSGAIEAALERGLEIAQNRFNTK
ncbi:MAG: aminoacyl-tRNA hydrolase [Candidatus Levybacteria bacterium]|nr:aminoacyl-tRNA hydrolase [Candidatus Levybacteria bacterium]